MKKPIIVAVLAFCAIILPTYLQAQVNETKLEMKPFGIGLHMEQFKLSDIYSDFGISPSNKVIFTINPSNNFRIEPEIGFSRFHDKDSDYKTTGLDFGLGAFYMFQKGKTNFYAGARLGSTSIKYDRQDWNTGDDVTAKTNLLSIAPTFGVEYFISDRMTIGGEINLRFLNITEDDGETDSDEYKYNLINTETGLFMRFYF